MSAKRKYNQLCVWPGTILDDVSIKEFENWFKGRGFRIRFCEVVVTLPDVVDGKKVKGTGGRHDVFFYIHDDDILKFSLPRLGMGIRWWEDVLDNGDGCIYPKSVLEKYPYSWSK